MYFRDERCVFVADSAGRAATIVAWLGGHGIAADVMNELTWGGFEGLTALVPGKLSLRGLEVWVKNSDDAERARQLMAAYAQEIAEQRAQRASREGNVEAICEDCGSASPFPAAEQGTIQNCPKCGAMLDVPDPDEDRAIGEPEEGNEQ
jgi:hypothetical protein